MKQVRSYPHVVVTKKQTIRVQDGHPWVYFDEIVEQSAEIENGALVDVRGHKNQYLGTGIWSEQSKIRIRILSNNANDTYDEAFFHRRVQYAVDYREKMMQEDFSACRLIHGESDGLPGVTVDRYEDILVSEVLSYGMDQRKQYIYEALVQVLKEKGVTVRGIYERNGGALRLKEGLPQEEGWYALSGLEENPSPIVEMTENGIRYIVDVADGQKTGYFLDQKYNRMAVRRIAKDMRILDVCTHTGTFALNAAMGGAKEVTAVDISASALETAKTNAQLNGLDVQFVESDMFEYLQKAKGNKQSWDMIILDPPAFTKSRKTLHSAKSGYERLNTLAMQILPRGGYLVTCSCSHFMTTKLFKEMLAKSAKNAGVSLRLIEERHASYDHPIRVGIDETDYLKFFLLQIM